MVCLVYQPRRRSERFGSREDNGPVDERRRRVAAQPGPEQPFVRRSVCPGELDQVHRVAV